MKHARHLFLVLFSLSACSRDELGKNPPPSRGAAPSAAPAASAGAPGAGDRSGSSIANAKALLPRAPVTFTVPCDGSPVYVGPFTLARDPERVVVRAEAKGTSKAQVCVTDAHWVDAKGGNPSIAGIPCVEDGRTEKATLSYEYSPGNGGASVNPVYWRIKLDGPKTAGCDTVQVTLSYP